VSSRSRPATPALVEEARKIMAFIRRDLLTMWTYRLGFFSDWVNMVIQIFLFSLIGRMVDPSVLPAYGGRQVGYIEFVAIDLALDMAGRFGESMGQAFVSDFLSVAADEAMHFAILERKLDSLGSFYGALPAHDGLWSAARDTAHDVAARLAIVPMVLEARGLDVTPATLTRVRAQGDENGVKILQRILDDEIRHVAFGAKHFRAICAARGENPPKSWRNLVKRHFSGGLKPPFNDSARSAAGLSRDFYAGIA